MSALALALSLLLGPQVPPATPSLLIDDPASSVCLATGFCRQTGRRGPAPGVLFVAVGLVAVGITGLRTRGNTPRGNTP